MAEKITNMDSVKVYESDMIKYSIIVNRRRAIPEIKDGLKVNKLFIETKSSSISNFVSAVNPADT